MLGDFYHRTAGVQMGSEAECRFSGQQSRARAPSARARIPPKMPQNSLWEDA
jgi:hypothetical protein